MTKDQRIAYHRRARMQTIDWVNGNARHNNIDDECCPDFSCCVPSLFTADKSGREEYARKRGHLPIH